MGERRWDLYDVLGAVAMAATPLAAALVFGWQMGTDVAGLTGSGLAAVVGGVCAAVGYEAVGILAGHTATEFWRRGDGRFWVTAVFLVGYAVTGAWKMRGTDLWILFPTAAAVYLLVGLRFSAQGEQREAAREAAAAQEQAAQAREWERKAQERAAARAHELALKREEGRIAVALKEAEMEAAAPAAKEPAANGSGQGAREPLACPDCGATHGKSGRPMLTAAAINAHRRFCEGGALTPGPSP